MRKFSASNMAPRSSTLTCRCSIFFSWAWGLTATPPPSFPASLLLQERTRLVAPVPQGRDEVRLTLTYPALQSARLTLFLVSGADKADAVRRVRAGDAGLPAGALRPQGDVIWLLDSAAAAGKHV